MIALRFHGRRDVRVDTLPDPDPTPRQFVVEVEYCGVCGTDLEEYLEGPVHVPTEPHGLSGAVAPLTLGHEIVGRVVEAARDGSGPAVGSLVIPNVVLGCGNCFWCRSDEEGLCRRGSVLGLHADGGLATFLTANADGAVTVPDGVDPSVAVFAEPTAVAVRALAKLPDPTGGRVFVLGAGTVGLLVMQAARAAGASLVIAADPSPARRDLARRCGADFSLDTAGDVCAVLADITNGRMADAVIECAGVPGAAAQAIRLTRRGGTCVLIGIHSKNESFDVADIVLGEKHVVGSAAHRWDTDVTVAVDLLATGRVDPRPLIADTIGLQALADTGFDRMASGQMPGTKLLVRPSLVDA